MFDQRNAVDVFYYGNAEDCRSVLGTALEKIESQQHEIERLQVLDIALRHLQDYLAQTAMRTLYGHVYGNAPNAVYLCLRDRTPWAEGVSAEGSTLTEVLIKLAGGTP